ncbi:hypothetical protein [Tsukamurella paurometabola]|uniref:HTH tetR-type domain-containing protein n=1 Tax=Tsukamurella paurometabola TaxID=2061 RepID=A0ABS5NDI0_TSUPA|nr:hypothetical protein [Tsukamurella paurometabola]MBS4102356.1 hypothetical protein [Tsukamurella paurometabola]
MTETEGRRYSGASAAARRDERRGRFLDAALTVVARDGLAAVSARALCAEAGLHARYFREAFASTDEVLDAAFDEVTAAVMRALADRIASIPPEAEDVVVRRVRAAVHASTVALDDDPRRTALLIAADGHAGLRARLDALVDLLAAAMVAQAEEILDDPAPAADAALAARLLVVGGLRLGIAANAGRIAAPPEQIEDVVVATILANRDFAALLRQVRGVSG